MKKKHQLTVINNDYRLNSLSSNLYMHNEEVAFYEIKCILRDSIKHVQENVTCINSKNILMRYEKVIKSVILILESKRDYQNVLIKIMLYDRALFFHSLNVAVYSIAIAIQMKLNTKAILSICLSSLIHDIGKIYIPKAVVEKPGKLTDEEFDIIKKHPEKGYNYLLNETDIPLLIALPSLQHHERLNGTGYPNNLISTQIHISSKIIAVADMFDALTSNRSYKKALTPTKAISIIMEDCGTALDNEVIESFISSITFYPEGNIIKINTGETGVIIANRPEHPFEPIIKVTHNQYYEEINSYEIDLLNTRVISIVESQPLLSFSSTSFNRITA